MGKLSNVFFVISFITLFSPIHCRHNHHDHEHDQNWIPYLPGIGLLMMNYTAEDQQITEKASELRGENFVSDSTESNTPDILMDGNTYYDNNDYNSNKSVVVGVPIGGIILFILICYCCYRCCCRPRVVVQGATIIRTPPPPPQTQAQVPIVIHNVTNTPSQPQQYPPPYHPTYEMGHPPHSMKQWNQVNQHVPPPQPYYGDPNAPPYGEPNAPPQYGRY